MLARLGGKEGWGGKGGGGEGGKNSRGREGRRSVVIPTHETDQPALADRPRNGIEALLEVRLYGQRVPGLQECLCVCVACEGAALF